jgi:two-component system KDP operon response regulator KdpE
MADRPTRILVVDDEPALLRILTVAIEARGFEVRAALTGTAAVELLAEHPPDAVILDLGLPDVDGLDLLRRIRTWSEMPIVVLTAEGAEERKVAALDDGADDYVTKPFSTPELLARLRAALRSRRPPEQPETTELGGGPLSVDLARHTVTLRGDRVELTPKEFALLVALARQPGRVRTHRHLLQEVWGPDYGTETQYLRVFMAQLRKKLADDPAQPLLITEPGVGYRLADLSPERDAATAPDALRP